MKKKMRWIVLIPLIIIASGGIGVWMVLTSNGLEDGLEPKADGPMNMPLYSVQK